MKMIFENKRLISAVVILAFCASLAMACTSMLVSARASGTGRPLMWKHRDTGAESNFIERVEAADGYGYVALFNGEDTLHTEAWMGMNDKGFAIMNTASYNLAPDTTTYKDMEGVMMSRALASCVTVDDFERLLETYPKPMGVQANFGVMDSAGRLAYFETDDYTYKRYDVDDAGCGYIIRTNHSMSGNDTDGMGYIRYDNVTVILADALACGQLTPELFTETASRSFYHSLLEKDFEKEPVRWVIDQDFIPRYISTASIVIEGAADPADMVMWAALGYPPTAVTVPVRLHSVPEYVRRMPGSQLSPGYAESLALKRLAFPIERGSGRHYIDMDFLRPVIIDCRRRSLENYASFRSAI